MKILNFRPRLETSIMYPTLFIHPPVPRVEITPRVTNVGLFQTARFDCVAYGVDIRGINWTRAGFTLSSDIVQRHFK